MTNLGGLVEYEDMTQFHAEAKPVRQHAGRMIITICVPEKTHHLCAGLGEQQDLQHPATVCSLLRSAHVLRLAPIFTQVCHLISKGRQVTCDADLGTE